MVQVNVSDIIDINDKDSIFLYLTISIVVLFFFTNVIKIQLGHILALIISIMILIFMITNKKTNVLDDNKEIEFKLNSLLDNEIPPDFFYTDIDMINLFFNIKQDMAKYNYDVYKNAVYCTNTVLNIRYNILRNLCSNPKPPNVMKNFEPSKHINIGKVYYEDEKDFYTVDKYEFKDDKKCDSTLINAYENYQIAEEKSRKALNYMHSLVISVPVQPVFVRKHEQVVNRLHVLLKRNLDDIKKRYDEKVKKNINYKTKFINNYELPKGYENFDKNIVKNNFNFY